jgi:hypothetical protein
LLFESLSYAYFRQNDTFLPEEFFRTFIVFFREKKVKTQAVLSPKIAAPWPILDIEKSFTKRRGRTLRPQITAGNACRWTDCSEEVLWA